MTFCFDVISPYAYLAFTQLRRIAGERPVELRPVLFAGLLNHHGQKGPAEIPAKKRYVFLDVLRIAAGFGVPLRAPLSHPFKPLLPLRVAGLEMEEEQRWALVDSLFRAVWVDEVDVTDPAVVDARAAAVGVEEASARASEPEAKLRLRTSTEAAIAEGVFGVPTVLVDGELFWGCDSLPHLERFLAGEDPVDPAQVARWDELVASARR